jgi:dolichyl-phosphate-mannose-protein mannosyltransferase
MSAVLAPEQAEQEPPPSAARPRPHRWPRPRRDATPPLPDDGRLSWLLTAALGVIALVSRLIGITYPKALLFDEAYYPPEAHDLLVWGHEYNRGYTFIVHPPLGKWLIALGEELFGYTSLGWRFRRRSPARSASSSSPGSDAG